MDAFALNLHRLLAAEGNLVWSPYSVAVALGLVAAGARGRTRDELAQALTPDGTLDELGRALARSATLRDAEAAVANSLWMRRGTRFHDEYRETVLGSPGGALHEADFAGDADGARRTINAEVAKTTRELIQNLLPPGVIGESTVAVVVNALYLKVAWLRPFDKNATRPLPFRTPSGERLPPTMRQVERMDYAEADGWRMVTLATPSEAVVDILLPDDPPEDGTLPDVVPLRRLRESARSRRVDLSLPVFRVEAGMSLSEPLRRLGVVDAFEADADFSGITDARVTVDEIAHKAVLKADEEGFEGAAATAVLMELSAIIDAGGPVEFHVDRPFLLVVRHRETGVPYFVARVVDP